MKRFLNNNTFYYFIIILTFIIIIAFSCVINDIKKIAEDPDFKIKWDVNVKAYVFDKESSPVSLREYVEDKAINPSEVTITPLPQWPESLGPVTLNGTIPINTDVDIDGGGSDFTLEGYYAARSDLLLLQVWLTDNVNTILPINVNSFTIGSITIEGDTINFGVPVSQGNVLVYTSTNFLDPANEYYLYLGGDGDIDISFNNVSLNNGAGTTPPGPYIGANPYTFHIKLIFNLGNDFGIVGEITNPDPLGTLLYSIADQNIPIGDIPAKKLDNFKLEFEYTSNLPFNLNINNIFYGSDKTPSPNTFNTVIASGVLSTSTPPSPPCPLGYSYQYVSSIKKSTDEFKFNDNVLSYGDMKLDLELRLPTPTGNKIRLDTNTLIKVKIIVSADATISL